MTSLDALRHDAIEAVRSTNWADPVDRFSTESYLAVYNASVPNGFQVGQSAVLMAELGDGAASSRVASQTVRDLEEAVAFMAKEIAKPGSTARLTATDYERAALVQSVVGGVVMLAPPRRQPGDDLFEGLGPLPSVTEVAFERLVALVPPTPDDRLDLDALLSTRTTSRRAVVRVLESAVRSGGLALSVSGVPQPRRATVSSAAAERVIKELALEDRASTEHAVVGVLEGARTVRRRFYLIPAHQGREIWGSVDESAIPDVARLVGQAVRARLEVTTTSQYSGRPSRTTYRLIAIEPAPATPDLLG